MIQKTIHYCWFGRGEMPDITLRCIESWKKHLPDYELVLWDEDNYDVNINSYVQEAYAAKKYAFVSDYARFDILYKYGGIYLDTDVEVVKPLDVFLKNDAFMGFQDEKHVAPGLIIGANKNNPIIKKILDSYKGRSFLLDNGEYDETTVVAYTTEILLDYGLKQDNTYQKLNGMTIYPKTYFCPLTYNSDREDFSDKTYTIHHFASSWMSEKRKKKESRSRRVREILKSIIGDRLFNQFKEIKRKFDFSHHNK